MSTVTATAAPFPGVTVTATPHGVSLAGQTFPVKDAIRAAGFRWNRLAKTWDGPADALTKLTAAPTAPAATTTTYPPTPEQAVILAAVAAGQTPVVVEALAGTGKIVEVRPRDRRRR